MKELHKKYVENHLTVTELQELRQQINAATDKDIEALLSHDWEQAESKETTLPESQLQRMNAKINQTLVPQRSNNSFILSFYRIAATILLPILLLSTLYFYHESRPKATPNMAISTEKGERANITLPDGTKVMLNGKSRLTYSPSTFGSDERNVYFEGEAHFSVVKKTSMPFIVHTDNIQLRVMGTKFNVMDRKTRDDVEVFLEQGRVQVLSKQSQKQVDMMPNQKATLNKANGIFHIEKQTSRQSLSWMKGELYFVNTPLKEILRSLESCYLIHFKSLPAPLSNDLFSGTLPAKDLLEALNILKEAYKLSYIITDNTITFSKAEN